MRGGIASHLGHLETAITGIEAAIHQKIDADSGLKEQRALPGNP